MDSRELDNATEHLEVWHQVEGPRNAPTVVLCNGGPGCCDYLEPVSQLLRDRWRVIRWEPRGCGRSPGATEYSLEQDLADLETLRRAYDCERWVIGGHSWGSELALLYALEHPDQTLAMFGLAGGVIHRDRQWHEEYKQGREEGLDPEPDFQYPPNMDVNIALNAQWRERVRQPDFLRRIADLNVPALFVAGGQDVRPHWPIAQTAALLPRGRFELFAEAGHVLWFTQKDQLQALLREFLQDVAPGSGQLT